MIIGKPIRGKIEAKALAEMVRQGLTTRQIADRFGVQAPAVTRACHSAGLPLPGTTVVASQPHNPELADEQPDSATELTQEAQLIATGGQYGKLAAWADKWGVSLTQARCLWHRTGLRIYVVKRK